MAGVRGGRGRRVEGQRRSGGGSDAAAHDATAVATPPVGYGLGDKRLGGVDGSPRSGGRPRRPPRPSLPETRSAVAQTAAQ